MARKPKPTDSLYVYRCYFTRIVDGDTVVLELDMGLGIWSRNLKGRLKDVWAPEIRDDGGAECYAELAKVLKTEYGFGLCKTYKDGKDNWGRLVVELWVGNGENEIDVNDHMREFCKNLAEKRNK